MGDWRGNRRTVFMGSCWPHTNFDLYENHWRKLLFCFVLSGSHRWLCVKSKLLQSCSVLCDPTMVTCQAPLSMGILQARILEWVAMPSSRGSSQPRDRTQVSCTAGGFFAIWATRKPRNTGVGSYPFSRGSSQPRNWTSGLLHCRQILYHLSRISGWIVVPFPMIGNTVRETDLREQAMRGARVWCGQIKVNMPLGHSSRYVGPFIYSTNNF